MADLLAGLRDEDSARTVETVDLLDELANRPEAQAWIAEQPGDGIQGKVVDVDVILSDYNDPKTNEPYRCPVWVIEDADGENWRVVGFTASLRNQMTKCDARPGDYVAVLYKGEGEPRARGQKPPKIHRCAIRRASEGAATA